MIGSLPVYLTPLIGREQELATLVQLLGHATVHLEAITGSSRVDKIRLAVALAVTQAGYRVLCAARPG